nr:ATP phosphoribosyltransferase regulatory subunit [Amphibacillus cookii]
MIVFLPAGSQDQIGEKLNKQAHVNQMFRTVVQRRDYKAIETPVVEYAETFTNPHVGMDFSKLLKWFDREGEIEVLRPDWTTAIARALMKQHRSQLKWFYQGSIFRQDKNGIESRQAGIEIIRTDAFLGEMESLFTAVDFLSALSIDNYMVELGHTGIFEYLTTPLGLDRKEEGLLRAAMHDKKKDVVYRLVLEKGHEDIAEQLVTLTQAFGGKSVLDDYMEKWQDVHELKEIICLLKKLVNALEELGDIDVTVDLGRVKQLPYYSGTMFRGYLTSSGDICFSGGRYDKLYKQFNQNISAVGLAFDVDQLAKIIKPQLEAKRLCIVASPNTHVKAEKMRRDYPEFRVDIQYQMPSSDQYDQIIQLADGVKR